MVDMDGINWKQRRKLVVRTMFNNVHGRLDRNIRRELELLIKKLDNVSKKDTKDEKGNEIGILKTDELASMLSEFTGRVICVLLFGEGWEKHISSDELRHIREINGEFAHTGIILNHFAQMILKYSFLFF